MNALFTGYFTATSLIMAIGAQNAYVLRQGIAKTNIFTVVLFCIVSDALLVTLGIFGIGAVIGENQLALQILKYTGVTFLFGYSFYSARKAFYGGSSLQIHSLQPESIRFVLCTIAALTYLNPHVYLDTVVLIGAASQQYTLPERWWFWVGATCASSLWFFALGSGAKALKPLFEQEASWRILDAAIAVIMAVIGGNLLLKR
jgi:L-lysine exporter family protein LysE/ArgO